MGLSIHGMRFPRPITEVLPALIGLRGEVRELQLGLLARFLAREAVTAIDEAAVFGRRPMPTRPLGDAYEELRERRQRQRTEQRRDPAIDTDCDVVLFPQGDATLAMLVGDLDGVDGLLETVGAQDWSWGHYERPDHLDDATWDARATNWTMAMGGDAGWVPSRRGLSYSYSDPLLTPSGAGAIFAAAPSLLARATEMARHEVARIAAVDTPKGEDAFQAVMRALWDTEAINAQRDRLLPLLPTLTAEALQHGLQTP